MKIRLKDIEMEYEERGEGKPLLLVHGFPLSRMMWEPQISSLSEYARVLAPDLRGHGGSTSTPGAYSMDLFASDLHEFLGQMGITEPVVLAGLSMGGYICFAFLRKYPERVAGLILAATRAAPDTEQGKQARDEMAAKAVEEGPGSVAEKMLPKMMAPGTYEDQPGLVDKIKSIMGTTSVNGMRGALLGMKDRPDSYDTLTQFRGPTLILHGEDDQLIPPSEAEAMQAVLSEAKLIMIPGAGHMLNLEQPDIFNRAAAAFLSSIV
jgi:3-oxoadipate enol-lactonase